MTSISNSMISLNSMISSTVLSLHLSLMFEELSPEGNSISTVSCWLVLAVFSWDFCKFSVLFFFRYIHHHFLWYNTVERVNTAFSKRSCNKWWSESFLKYLPEHSRNFSFTEPEVSAEHLYLLHRCRDIGLHGAIHCNIQRLKKVRQFGRKTHEYDVVFNGGIDKPRWAEAPSNVSSRGLSDGAWRRNTLINHSVNIAWSTKPVSLWL